jgi:hypothetical protein
MFSFIPDANQLTSIFALAAGPAFLLGAVAGFISLLMSRLKSITDQLDRSVEIGVSGSDQTRHKQDITELKRRALLLNSATYLALCAGICTTLLLMLAFASAFFRLQHVYGGALLFAAANGLLTVSLYKFAREVKASLSEIDHF